MSLSVTSRHLDKPSRTLPLIHSSDPSIWNEEEMLDLPASRWARRPPGDIKKISLGGDSPLRRRGESPPKEIFFDICPIFLSSVFPLSKIPSASMLEEHPPN